MLETAVVIFQLVVVHLMIYQSLVFCGGKEKTQKSEQTGNTPKRMGGSGEVKAPSAHSQPPASAPAQQPPAAPPAAAPARPPAPVAPPPNDDGNYEEIRVGDCPPPPPPA